MAAVAGGHSGRSTGAGRGVLGRHDGAHRGHGTCVQGVGVPGCEGLQGERQHFQAGQTHLQVKGVGVPGCEGLQGE